MITDILLQLSVVAFTPILNIIPSLDGLVIPDNIANYLLGIFRSIGVFIPIADLMPLFVFSILFTSWRLVYSIINRIRFFI